MSVHYKFKSTLDFDTITFDGLHISVADLKKAIIQQKRLGKTVDFDLQITNAQTKEEYNDDNMLIPKNTSLTIARVPVKSQGKKNWEKAVPEQNAPAPTPRGKHDAASSQTNVDLSMMNGTEEDKIREMMFQSTAEYDPTNYQKVRGTQTGEVPMNYKCYRCHKPGHWIKNCPMGPLPKENMEVKRTSGIPRSFIERDKEVGNNPAMQPVQMPPEEKQVIPEDLICSICKDLFTDAVMIPCCGSSFCDECVRTALLESEDNECPDCKEKGSSPGSLIPNRFLRTSVNAFRNETGYTKSKATVGKKQTKPEEIPTADSTTSGGLSSTVPFGDVEDSAPIGSSISTTTEMVESSTYEDDGGHRNVDAIHQQQPQLFDEISLQDDLASPRQDNKESTGMAPSAGPGFDNESDYEDNITVTVPPAHLQSRGAFRGHYNGGGRPMRHGRTHGHDTPPNERQQMIVNQQGGYGAGGNGNNGGRGNDHMDREREEEHRRRMLMEEKDGDGYGAGPPGMINERGREYGDRSPEYLHGGNGGGGGGVGGRGLMPIPHNHPQHVQAIGTAMGHPGGAYMGPGNGGYGGHVGHPPYGGAGGVGGGSGGGGGGNNGPGGGGYGMQQGSGGYPQQQRSYEHHGGMYPGDRPTRMMYPMRGGGGFMSHHPPHLRQRPMGPGPMGGYPSVHPSIGPGVIDDPLEAFNRIMREKELRKKQEQQQQQMRRNRSPMVDRGRRSRSFDNGGRGGPRGNSSDRRRTSRQRSPERRRSPDDKHPDERDRMRERRRNRSSSYSSGSSRSYTRSKSRSPMKRNKSPRKRSRSPGYRDRRSRSRSGSFGGMRYRDRRDERRQGDFNRDRSPGFNPGFGFGNRPPRGGGGPRGGRARGNNRDVGGNMQHFPPRGYDRHQPGHMLPMQGGRPDDIPPAFLHGQHMNEYRDGHGPVSQHGGGMMGSGGLGGGPGPSMQTGLVASAQSNRYPGRDERERSIGANYGGAKQPDFGDGEGDHMVHSHTKGMGERYRTSSRNSSPSGPHQQNVAHDQAERGREQGEWSEFPDESGYHQPATSARQHDDHVDRQSAERKSGAGSARDSDHRSVDHRPSSIGPAGGGGGNHGRGRSRSRDRKRQATGNQEGSDRDGSDRRKYRSKRSESAERHEKSNAANRGARSTGEHEKEKQDRKQHQMPEKEKRNEQEQHGRRDERDHHRDRGKERNERDRDRERERDRQRERERDREKERNKDKERDLEHDRERDRRKEKERDKEKEKEREREKEREQEKEKEREKERLREREKDREKDREKEKDHRDKEKDRDKDKEAKELSKKKARDSSDEDRRDRKKDRDKKKRKKEKEVEKRKHKKERKEKDKEQRSKDRRKERKTVEKEEPDSSQQPATPTVRDRDEEAMAKPTTAELEDANSHRARDSQSNDGDDHERPASVASEDPKRDIDSGDSGADDEEHPDTEPHPEQQQPQSDVEQSEHQQQEAHIDGHDHADLYSDIPDKYEADQLELCATGANDQEEEGMPGLADSTESQETPAKLDTTGDGDMLMKRSDSVLDLHANLDYEQELDSGDQTLSIPPKDDNSVMPELSKWEMDEEGQINSSTVEQQDATSPADQLEDGSDKDGLELDGGGKVTSEVLKRAENAIFARAINAIRPIEIKKISVERQKLYTAGNMPHEDGSPPRVMDIKHAHESDEFKRVQVTIPLHDVRAERSVEIKQKLEMKVENRSSPIRTSVKERLGSKVTDNASHFARSRTPSTNRKMSSVPSDNMNRVKSFADRRRGSSRSRSRLRDESGGRKQMDRNRSSGGGKREENKKQQSGQSNRRTASGNGGRGNDDRQQSLRDRKEDTRRNSREKSDSRKVEQQRLQRGRSRDHEREKDRDRDNRDRGSGRRGNSRDRKQTVSPPPISKKAESSRKDVDTHRSKHHSQREDTSGRVSSSKSSHRDDSANPKSREATDERGVTAPSSTTGVERLTARSEQSPADRTPSRKRSAEHLRERSTERDRCDVGAAKRDDTVAGGTGASGKRTKVEKHAGKSNKSSSDSSSSDSDTSSSDSSPETDDAGPTGSSSKKRKKRKHKKERKRAKRSAATTETDDDSGGKRKKSKKKSKSSKKKKKSSKHKKD